MKHIKSYTLFESNNQDESDHEEVKQILKDWFDSYTDDITEINTGRIYTSTEGECLSCRSYETAISLGVDYDSGKTLYQCPNCEHVGEKFEFELTISMIPYSVWNKDVMNCITIRNVETLDFSLRLLTDEQIKHINSIINPFDYTYFKWGQSERNFNFTITTFKNIENIKSKIDSNDTEVKIFYPRRFTKRI